MIKPIVKDIFFLRRKAETATREDIQVGIDLQDTLRANRANNQLTFRALQSLTEGVFRITQIESETVLYSVPYGFTLPQIDRE